MSWKGNYWGPFGVIQKAERDYYEGVRTTADMVTLASVHYSAAGTAFARLKQGRIHYLWRLWFARSRALMLANNAFDVGGSFFTADQVDVVCSIWWQFDRRTKRAVAALGRLDNISQEKPHTQAFLLMHLIRFGEAFLSPVLVDRVLQLAERSIGANELAQAGRIYRQLYDLVPADDLLRLSLREQAAECARRGGATDQLEKMGLRAH